MIGGEWLDFYTGRLFTDPGELDIDHFVPLGEVHRSGGDTWAPEQRVAYANDLSSPDTLIAVSASANRSKGDRDPADWLPPNRAFHCTYIALWLKVKERWGMSFDAREVSAIAQLQASICREPK